MLAFEKNFVYDVIKLGVIKMYIRQYVALKIREYRKTQGLTQKELGEKIGVKHNTISGWESCKTEPEQDHLFKIAQVLGVSINDLFPKTTSDTFSQNEKSLLGDFRVLNDNGQQFALTTVHSLTLNPDFINQSASTSESAM